MPSTLVLLLLLSALVASAASSSPRVLTGPWFDGSQQYVLTPTASDSVFDAACIAGGCATWTAAVITVADEVRGACVIVFTGEHGRNHTGQLNGDNSVVTWSDKSVWVRAQPPAPPLPYIVDVVVVPHTHDDAGWQRTFEGYYDVEVSPILANVVSWLTGNPDARFIWVETSFLQRWWVDQNETMRAAFTALVQSRRLELVSGGWTMHDEESTNAFSTVSNMAYGLTWLQDTFGPSYRPRHAWQIDPSGHALLTPTLMASLGFDSLVIDRVPDPVRQALRRNLSLQFVWTGVETRAVASPAILAFVLDSFYCSVGLAGSTPKEQAASFFADIQRRMHLLRPDAHGKLTILYPWGCDFSFQHIKDFDELVNVLAYMRANASEFVNVTARFGTLSDFYDTLHSQPMVFPEQGARDFHPYRWCVASEPDTDCTHLPTTPDPAYWRTGMFTSKGALKGATRVVDASLHAMDGLYAIAQLQAGAAALPPVWLSAVGAGRATSGLLTHHDAVTGTAYETCSLGPPYTQCNCYEDYMLRMAAALEGLEDSAGAAKGVLLAPAGSTSPPVFLNASTASAGLVAGSNVLVVAVGNPLGWARREIVRLVLQSPSAASATVTDLRTGAPTPSQVVSDALRGTRTLFFVADVPPLSTVAYAVAATSTATPTDNATPASGAVVLDNGVFALTFDATGHVASFTNRSSGIVLPLSHDFLFYPEVIAGTNLIGGSVYGFEPSAPPVPLAPTGATVPVTVSAAGPLVWEATQAVNSEYLLATWRLFAPQLGPPATPTWGYAAAPPIGEGLELQARVGPLPSAGLGGGSYVSQFTPGVGCSAAGASSPLSSLTTDASGFQTLRRPAFVDGALQQSQVYPASPGWDMVFGACDGSGSSPGLLSHTMQRPTGTAVSSNTSVWTMLHRRLLNPTDPRGNDSAVLDDVVSLGIADGTSDWAGAVLPARQVLGRTTTHPLTLHGALFASPAAYLATAAASFTPPWLTSSLPPGILLHSLLVREAPYPAAPSGEAAVPSMPVRSNVLRAAASNASTFAARFQLLPHMPPSSFVLEEWLGGGSGGPLGSISAQEVTVDLNADKASADARRFVWPTSAGHSRLRQGLEDPSLPRHQARSQGAPPQALAEGRAKGGASTVVAFDAEFVRSYLIFTTR